MVFSGGFFFILWSLKEVVSSVRSSPYPGLDIYHWMHWGNACVCRQVASQNVYDMLSLPTEASYRLFLTTFRPSWAGFRCKCFALRIVSPTLWGAFFMLLCFNMWLQCRRLVSQEMITWVVVDWPTAERTCSLFIHLASPTRPHCAPSLFAASVSRKKSILLHWWCRALHCWLVPHWSKSCRNYEFGGMLRCFQ